MGLREVTKRLFCCVLGAMAHRFKGVSVGRPERRNERNVAFRAVEPASSTWRRGKANSIDLGDIFQEER